MISFDEIEGLWKALDTDLHTMPYTKEDYPDLDEKTIRFLNISGFPEDAEPGLDFTDLLAGKIFTHGQLYTREDFPLLDSYLVIGATGEGNPFCIDMANGEVIVVDHDNEFSRVFVNSSLPLFSYSLALSQQLYTQDHGPELLNSVRQKLEAADPPCLQPETYWFAEFSGMR